MRRPVAGVFAAMPQRDDTAHIGYRAKM